MVYLYVMEIERDRGEERGTACDICHRERRRDRDKERVLERERKRNVILCHGEREF